MNRLFIALLMLATLAACNKAQESTEAASAQKPVADPIVAAKGFYDGTNTGPYVALKKACREEAASGSRGVNCEAYDKAAAEGDKLVRANPAGFVGFRLK